MFTVFKCSSVQGVNIVNIVNTLPKISDFSAKQLMYYRSIEFIRKKVKCPWEK